MHDDVRRIGELLLKKGYQFGDTLLCEETVGAAHQELEWAKRLPHALRFLLPT